MANFKTLICILMTLNVFAGEGVVGNGGNIISCGTLQTPNQINYNNKTLELFELKYLYGYSEISKPFQFLEEGQIIESILSKVKRFDLNFYSYLELELNHFEKNSKHFNYEFNFSNDLDQTIVPSDCLIKTVIFQRKTTPFFLVSKLWETLPQISKASLKLHEVIYKYRLSMYPQKSSSFSVRKLNAYLFSSNFSTTIDDAELINLITELKH